MGQKTHNSIEFFQINAFSSEQFWGNPAVVCPLNEWVDSAAMQKIAAENNRTTAFVVGVNGRYDIRWFTPTAELNGICGHGTLAAGHVVLRELESATKEVVFHSGAGELRVRSASCGQLILDLPALPPDPFPLSPSQREVLHEPIETTMGALDFIAVLGSESSVKNFDPDAEGLISLPLRALVVTARGDNSDFVSRWFGPKMGEREDIGITGSAHCSLVPYWAERLGKSKLRARQFSPRGGSLDCELRGDRVWLHSAAVTYTHGRLRF